ncbi:BQ2448_2269 [Microbotryum intermedium]|uniref:BQ2448_2269 protein n=1 Tax=Microbotryum intermedium TaxID=269621 RepID=A0A238F912_9BASI|nr:BQ2448_2269 [Microbotryum intermedium]
MPYATPSSLSSSPTSTMTLTTTNRSMAPRPARHHMRSHSSDAIPTSGSGSHKQASFIYVQPASPEGDKARSASIDARWSSTANAVAGPSNAEPPKPRRIKLFGFTPASAANEDGPSSQDESSPNEAARFDDDQSTPRAENANYTTNFTFATSGVPLVPLPSRTTSTPIVSAMRGSGRAKSDFTARTSAMVRKKSGELVRSSLKGGDPLRRDKPRSAPSTPIGAKYVHFDTQLEHVKHFIAQQRPAAVSRSGSPVETETEDEPEAFPFPAMASAQAGSISLRLPNFPARLDHDQDAYVESLEMASDGKSIRGIIRVRNLSFEKWVAVRFTLDNWQTVSEVSAEHHESMGSMSDRFVFTIKLQDLLARLEAKTMFIAVRYNVGNREIWDNNGGQNYRVEFVKNPPTLNGPHAVASAHAASGKRQGWTLGIGSHSADPIADLRRELDRLVMDDDLEPTAHHSTRSFTEGSPSMFSSRYDFGNSLKMFGTRPSTHFDGFGHPPSASPPKMNKAYSTTNIVGGMPATVYHEPASTASSAYSHGPAPASASSLKTSAPLGSPVTTRGDLPPDFGSTTLQQYQAASPLYSNASPLYPAPPTGHRAPSPPPEAELARLYSGYQDRPFLPVQDTKMKTAVRTSYHKPLVPPSGAQIPSSMMHYTPLLPPTFRDRSHRSPLASPMNSPHDSPSISPQTMSPPRKASPPLYPDVSPPEEALWSPASSSTDPPSSVNSSDARSVDSEATSVAGSPLQGTINRPSGPMEFSSFLDRYCFHTGGLNGRPNDSSSDLATTPRRSMLSGCGNGTGYYSPAVSSRASSGASTPPREDAAYVTTFPSAVVS